jgi:hypothetical protein
MENLDLGYAGEPLVEMPSKASTSLVGLDIGHLGGPFLFRDVSRMRLPDTDAPALNFGFMGAPFVSVKTGDAARTKEYAYAGAPMFFLFIPEKKPNMFLLM